MPFKHYNTLYHIIELASAPTGRECRHLTDEAKGGIDWSVSVASVAQWTGAIFALFCRDGLKSKRMAKVSVSALEDALVLGMVNTAFHVLGEDTVSRPEDIDLLLVMAMVGAPDGKEVP